MMGDKDLNPQLQRYLDGEISRDALSPEMQREADNFENWLRINVSAGTEHAPAGLTNRIMVSLPPAPQTPLHERLLTFLVEPKRIRIRPLTVGLAAAALAALVLISESPTDTIAPAA